MIYWCMHVWYSLQLCFFFVAAAVIEWLFVPRLPSVSILRESMEYCTSIYILLFLVGVPESTSEKKKDIVTGIPEEYNRT